MRLLKGAHRDNLIISGVVVVILLCTLLLFRYKPKPASTPNTPIVVEAEAAEAAFKPEEYKWIGLAEEPKRISLPSIQAEGFVEKVGLKNNQIVAPSNINLAGWYKDSVKPGQVGLSVIDGHVDGASKPGIFKQLEQLQAGSEFNIELGGGKILHYSVLTVAAVPTSDALNVLFSQDPKVKSQLNLITCGGDYNKVSGQYEKRVIVAAKLI